MSGETSGLRATCWNTAPAIAERGARQQRGQHARQAQVEHDEVDGRVARAGERGEHVERRDGVLADRDPGDQRRAATADSAAVTASGRRPARNETAPRRTTITAPPSGAGGRAR